MIVKVDWISFSLPMEGNADNDRSVILDFVNAIDDLHPELSSLLALSNDFQARNGRAPYSISYLRADMGMAVFCHPNLSHSLVEITGRGCERLAQEGTLEKVLSIVAERATRIDIACDMVTDTRPAQFCAERHTGRFKAHSTVVSESGETVYIGARSSDRYARVYRYNAPHERSHLLRCEFVVKAENAKLLIPALLAQGVMPIAAALGDTFGWQHRAWQVSEEAGEIEVYRPERREGKTLFWLADTIAPLLARLHREGVIDVDLWLDQHVRERLKG